MTRIVSLVALVCSHLFGGLAEEFEVRHLEHAVEPSS